MKYFSCASCLTAVFFFNWKSKMSNLISKWNRKACHLELGILGLTTDWSKFSIVQSSWFSKLAFSCFHPHWNWYSAFLTKDVKNAEDVKVVKKHWTCTHKCTEMHQMYLVEWAVCSINFLSEIWNSSKTKFGGDRTKWTIRTPPNMMISDWQPQEKLSTVLLF